MSNEEQEYEIKLNKFDSEAETKLKEKNAEEAATILAEVFGITVIKCYLKRLTGLFPSYDSNNKYISRLSSYFSKTTAIALRNKCAEFDKKEFAAKTTYCNAVEKVAALGYDQHYMKYTTDAEGKPVNKELRTCSEFLKSINLVNGCKIMVVKKKEQVVGIGNVIAGRVDYSAPTNAIKPLEFEKCGIAFSAIGTLMSSVVEITKENVIKPVPIQGEYCELMQYDKIMATPADSCKNLSMVFMDLFMKMKHIMSTIPSGKGKQIEMWCYNFLRKCASIEYAKKSMPYLKAVAEEYKKIFSAFGGYMEFLEVGGCIGVKLKFPKALVESRTSTGTVLFEKKKSKEKDAHDSVVRRRRTDNTDNTGRSGLSIHVYNGYIMPKSMVDVVTLATDLSTFILAYPGMIGAYTQTGNYEALLRVLKFLNYGGKVYINDRTVIMKLLMKYDVNKGKAGAIVITDNGGKFADASFQVIVATPSDDVPMIYHFLYGFRKTVFDEATREYQKARENAVVTSKIYIKNVCLYDIEVSENVYVSCEAHNLTGYESNAPVIVDKIKRDKKALLKWAAGDYSDNYVDFAYPFDDDTKGYAFGFSIMCNCIRAQYPFTNETVDDVFDKVDSYMHRTMLRGKFGASMANEVKFDGMTVEVMCASASVKEYYESIGSEEIKAMIAMTVANVSPAAEEKKKEENSLMGTVKREITNADELAIEF